MRLASPTLDWELVRSETDARVRRAYRRRSRRCRRSDGGPGRPKLRGSASEVDAVSRDAADRISRSACASDSPAMPVGCRPAQLAIDLADDLFELRIVACERQRAAVELERAFQIPAPLLDLGHAADGGEIVGRGLEDELQFRLGLLELPELDQRAAERDPCGEISGMAREAGAAALLRRLIVAGATVFLGQLGEGNRGRVGLDPASQIGDARAF